MNACCIGWRDPSGDATPSTVRTSRPADEADESSVGQVEIECVDCTVEHRVLLPHGTQPLGAHHLVGQPDGGGGPSFDRTDDDTLHATECRAKQLGDLALRRLE